MSDENDQELESQEGEPPEPVHEFSLRVEVDHFVGTVDPKDNNCDPLARIRVENKHIGYMAIMPPEAPFCWLPKKNMPIELTIEEKIWVVKETRKKILDIREHLAAQYEEYLRVSG